MRIVSWNVNSVRRRLEKVVPWMEEHQPDALCLQETKVVDEDFPAEAFEAIGYRSTFHGQKTYNGVAILTKDEVTDVRRGFDDGDEEHPHARILRATLGGVRLVNVYVPNGKEVGSEHYAGKLVWLDRLRAMLDAHEDPAAPLVLLGDFNVTFDDRDVHDPALWEGKVHASEPERAKLQQLMDFGLTDCMRMHHEEEGLYSWWDYRGLAFQFRKGLRIDFLLATESLASACTDCVVDKDARRGKGTSDHAPVVGDFDVG